MALSFGLMVAIGAQNSFVLARVSDGSTWAVGAVLRHEGFARPRGWRVLDGVIGLNMLTLAALLLHQVCRGG